MATIDYKQKIKDYMNSSEVDTLYKSMLNNLFPELKESEDERIRKELIKGFKESGWTHFSDELTINDAIAWLEKQGEHAKFWDSIQVGDKVTRNQDGVLVNLSRLKRVAKRDEKQGEQKPAESIKEYDFHGVKFIPKFAKGDIIKDKKRGEVSTIKDFSYDTGLYTHTYGQFPITIQDNYEIIKQKPAWSEEDDIMKQHCHQMLALLRPNSSELTKDIIDNCHHWLKKIKNRVQQQSQWKPSDEQIESLSHMIDAVESEWACEETIGRELLKQLKELRGE